MGDCFGRWGGLPLHSNDGLSRWAINITIKSIEKNIEAAENQASVETPIKSKKEQPKDVVEIGRQGQWSLALSKKGKCLIVKTHYEDEEPLLLSRKELYVIGKMMNKRSKHMRKAALQTGKPKNLHGVPR